MRNTIAHGESAPCERSPRQSRHDEVNLLVQYLVCRAQPRFQMRQEQEGNEARDVVVSGKGVGRLGGNKELELMSAMEERT